MQPYCPHAWCIRTDHAESPDVHESAPLIVDPADTGCRPGPKLSAVISYVDGERAPRLHLGNVVLDLAGAVKTVDGLGGLIGMLRSVQTTGQVVTR